MRSASYLPFSRERSQKAISTPTSGFPGFVQNHLEGPFMLSIPDAAGLTGVPGCPHFDPVSGTPGAADLGTTF